ncbi:MAG: MBOAT family protein [Clostridium sp.]|nr:MBOAT family protein [Clostridium sp.]
MAFSSIPFLCAFFPVVLAVYYLIPSMKVKNFFLIAASLLFYAYGEEYYVLLMIACALFNYIFARLIARFERAGKFFLLLAVVGNLGVLGTYKYTGMVLTTINHLTKLNLDIPKIRLPIGISFFTFQALSYVIDVYRRKVKADRNFLNILLYLSFFPQLIAGPIIQYHSVAEQLKQRRADGDKICRGMRRFIIGLSKKVLLSDTMAVTADYVFSLSAGELGMAAAWVGAAAYMLQIYFDFSGYSDMAIGMGKMFGFDFPENFRFPYTAASMQDFWRRWHISLTGWFREYLYIPLGGNRKGKLCTGFNRLTVFFFTGLWHGADWTFVLWGLFHGAFLTLETLIPWKKHKFRVLNRIYVLLVVCVGFVLFRADTIGQAGMILSVMFTGGGWNPLIAASTMRIFDRLFLSVFAIAIVCSLPVGHWLEAWCVKHKEKGKRIRGVIEGACYAVSIFLLFACVMSLAGGTFHPFIYFRF